MISPICFDYFAGTGAGVDIPDLALWEATSQAKLFTDVNPKRTSSTNGIFFMNVSLVYGWDFMLPKSISGVKISLISIESKERSNGVIQGATLHFP